MKGMKGMEGRGVKKIRKQMEAEGMKRDGEERGDERTMKRKKSLPTRHESVHA